MDFFKTSRWCLGIVGHNFQDCSKDWTAKWHWLHLSIVASGNIWMIWFTAHFIKDLPTATAALSVSMTNMLTILKWAVFLRKKKFFNIQMDELIKLNENFKNKGKEHQLLKACKTVTKFEQRYCRLCIITGFYFCLMALVKILWHNYVIGEPVFMQLPFPMKLFFEYQSVLPYSVLYIYNLHITWFVCLYVPGIDSLYYSFTIIVSTHFRILQDAIMTNDFKGNEHEMHETISNFVKYHNYLLDLSERIRVIFELVIIFQFLMTSLQVCLIVFQMVTNTRDFSVLIPNSTFIFVILVQLLIYCYGGESVMYESSQVNNAIQLSQWNNLSPNLQRPLVLIMQRSQRPLMIKAGFYKATLESFMNIVQTAASYITMMRSLQ